MNMQAIIMAAGEGKRMQSPLPKVLHEVDGEAMIFRILKKVAAKGVSKVYIVCGKNLEMIQDYIEARKLSLYDVEVIYVIQSVPMGTGDAIRQCLPVLDGESDDTTFMILNGDTPLIDSTIDTLMQFPAPTLMVTQLNNPHGQGRVITSVDGKFLRIVEEKDATDEQRAVQVVNCGVYLVTLKHLRNLLPKLTNNNKQNEYYLTDICGMLANELSLYHVSKNLQYELLNVNTQDDLQKASILSTRVYLASLKYDFRTLGPLDYEKGYLQLMSQLSNTIDELDSKDAFMDILQLIKSNPNHTVYVIEDLTTQQVIASTTLLKEPKFIHNGKSVGHIEDVVVRMDYRGQKLANHLVKLVTCDAELSGQCYKCILDCKEELEKMYAGAGYKRNGIQMSKYF